MRAESVKKNEIPPETESHRQFTIEVSQQQDGRQRFQTSPKNTKKLIFGEV